MTYASRLFSLICPIALLGLTLTASSASGQINEDWEVVRADGPPQKSWTGQKSHEERRTQATLDMRPLQEEDVQVGDQIQLALFQNQHVGTVTSVTEHVPGVLQVRGDLDSGEWGYFVLSYREGRTRMMIRPIGEHDGSFEVRYDPNLESHVLIENGPEVFRPGPRDDAARPPNSDSGPSGVGKAEEGESSKSSESSPSRVTGESPKLDVMVVYTPAVEAEKEDIGLAISQQIGETQETIENTEVDLEVNLAHYEEVDYSGSGNTYTDLLRLTDSYTYDYVDGEYMNEVHHWRFEHQADLVALIVEGASGYGWIPGGFGEEGVPEHGFFVTGGAGLGSFNSWLFTHELGHTTGMHHSRMQDYNAAPEDGGRVEYATGWRWITDEDPYVSTMSYVEFENVDATRLPTFSSPDLLHEDEVPKGSDGENGDVSWPPSVHQEYGPADNRQSLQDIKAGLTSQGTSPYVTPDVMVPTRVLGNAPADTLIIPVQSTGNAIFSGQMDLKGPDAQEFELLSPDTLDVLPQEIDSVRISYDPATPNEHEAVLEVAHNASNKKDPFKVNLEVVDPDHFITTWRTTSSEESITIPTETSPVDSNTISTEMSPVDYDFEIHWGDGTTESYSGEDPDPSHTYSSAGSHTIEISGTFPRIFLNDPFDRNPNSNKLQQIDQWGAIQWESMQGAFAGAKNVISPASDAPDLTNVNSMSRMFAGAHRFNGDVSSWNVSNAVNMSDMFSGASSFNQNIGRWDVSNVTDMSGMFRHASSFNQEIDDWDISSVTSTVDMFREAYSFNQDIGAWNTGNVTDMRAMFRLASSFDQDISDWDVSGVEHFEHEVFGGFLNGSNISSTNYDALLIGWAVQDLNGNIKLGAGAEYCNGDPFRTHLTKAFGWTINDGGQATGCPKEVLHGSESQQIDTDGVFQFGPLGMSLDVSDLQTSGRVTATRYGNSPNNVEGISETNISQYRVVIAGGGVSFDSADLRFAVSELDGIDQPGDVTVYSRKQPDDGTFEALPTTVDDNGTSDDISDDTLSVTTGSLSEFVFASDDNPLPVEIAKFRGATIEDGVRLTWQTSSETNNAGFEIQRKVENSLWEQVGYVTSKASGGTTAEAQSYQYTTKDLSVGTHQFRLKQVDLDGNSMIHGPIEVQVQMEKALSLTPPVPNPVSSTATLSFAVKEQGQATVAVYDMLGRRAAILFKGSPTPGESNRLELNASNFSSGSYILRLRASGQTESQRMTVVR